MDTLLEYTEFYVFHARDGRTVDERTFHFFNSLISVAISMFELIDRLAPALLVPCAATRRNAAPIILLT